MKNFVIRALLSFKRYGDDAILFFTTVVIQSMTGNTRFTNTTDVLAALTTAYNEYASAQKDAATGNRTDIQRKKAKRKALNDALSAVVKLVNFQKLNDAEAIASSGLDYTKPSPGPTPLTLPDVNVSYISGGKFEIKLKSKKKYEGVVYQYAPDDGSVHVLNGEPLWITVPCGDMSCIISNLPVGQKLLVRVGVWSAKEPVIYTEPISRMVA